MGQHIYNIKIGNEIRIPNSYNINEYGDDLDILTIIKGQILSITAITQTYSGDSIIFQILPNLLISEITTLNLIINNYKAKSGFTDIENFNKNYENYFIKNIKNSFISPNGLDSETEVRNFLSNNPINEFDLCFSGMSNKYNQIGWSGLTYSEKRIIGKNYISLTGESIQVLNSEELLFNKNRNAHMLGIIFSFNAIKQAYDIQGKYFGNNLYEKYNALNYSSKIDNKNKINIVTGATGNISIFSNDGNLENTQIPLTGITGQTIILQNNNNNVSNTPNDIINFDSGFTISANTNNEATISLTPVVDNPLNNLCELKDTIGNQELNNVIPTPLNWGLSEFVDTNVFIHISGTSKITVLKKGYYEISYNINSANQTNGRSTTGVQIGINGTKLIDKTLTADYTRNSSNNDNNNVLPPTTIFLNINDFIQLGGFRLGNNNSTLTKAGASFLKIKFLG